MGFPAGPLAAKRSDLCGAANVCYPPFADIAVRGSYLGPRKELVQGWAAQAAISRPGRSKLNVRNEDDLRLFVEDFDKLRWLKDRTR